MDVIGFLLVLTQCSQGLWQVIFAGHVEQSHHFLGLGTTKTVLESLLSISTVLSSFLVSMLGQLSSFPSSMLVHHIGV